MDRSERGHGVTAALVMQFCELRERHTAKLLARALGVSIRSAKRYKANPELFPASRAVDLLRALEEEEAVQEARREQRRLEREAALREIQSALGVDRPSRALSQDGAGRGPMGDGLGEDGPLLPLAGDAAAVASRAALRGRR